MLNLNNWQVLLSSQRWPPINYWPKLAENYGIKFNNSNLTYEKTSRMYINSSEVGNPDKLLTIMNEIEGFINKNYLKVRFFVLIVPRVNTSCLLATNLYPKIHQIFSAVQVLSECLHRLLLTNKNVRNLFTANTPKCITVNLPYNEYRYVFLDWT